MKLVLWDPGFGLRAGARTLGFKGKVGNIRDFNITMNRMWDLVFL